MADQRLLTGLSSKDEVKNIKLQLAQAQLDRLHAEAALYEFEGFDMDDYAGLVPQKSEAEIALRRADNRLRFWQEKVELVERIAASEAQLNGAAAN